ncbi:MAG TPA: ABC transporter permease, partial [Anaerolineae bacterium]|nr:ABC transporter permease [Anaerolineae bacterium]
RNGASASLHPRRTGWRRRRRPGSARAGTPPLLSPNSGPRLAWGPGTRRKDREGDGGAFVEPAGRPRRARRFLPARLHPRQAAPRDFVRGLGRLARGIGSGLRETVRYPSAIVGLFLILALVGMSVYAIVAVPLDEAIKMSRGARNDWYVAPAFAQPAWVNFFRKDDLPLTILMDSGEETVTKTVEVVSEDMTRVSLSFPFDYPYDDIPQDILVFVRTNTGQKRPYVVFTWSTPDGRQIEIVNRGLRGSAETYYLSADTRFRRKAGEQEPLELLFYPPGAADGPPVQGRYELKVEGLVFEENAEFDARLVVEGRVYGLAGTDHLGRDLTVPLLWGTPVALAFGLLGAVGTAVASLIIAAAGTWFGGWVDELVQRLTEVNMILPTLPIAIMVYLAYSKSVWVILGVMVILNIFSSAIKNYRAIFLQVKEAPYVEAARVYGASDRRIVLRYLVPKILPILVPHLVTLIPGYVFLEATLAYLGVSDPILPTWGKVVYEALRNGAFQGHYYWVLEPIGLLLLTGLAFALLGFALDRIFNPRLRSL